MDILLLYKSLMINDTDHGSNIHKAPLSLLTIAASARHAGYDVGIYNLSCFSKHGENEFLANLPSVNYLIGLSQFTTNRHATYTVARKLKKRYPQVPIVIGGAHASLFPEEILRGHPEIDYIVIGEGDYAIQKLLGVLQNDGNVESIENLAWRSGEYVYINNISNEISNLDDLPYTQDYYANNLILTSRGCPYPCTFCGANRNVRTKTFSRVMSELNKLIQIHGINHVAFVDDLFALNDKRVKEMTTAILSLSAPITYECNLRANVTTEVMVQNLVKSGCMTVYLGAESGSEDMLRTYKKQITPDQLIKAVQICRAYCLRVGVSFIFSKYDDEKSFEKTQHLLEKAQPIFMSVSPTFLYPGTLLYRDAVAAGEVDAGIWEQSDKAMPPEAFSGYPEKYVCARDFSARLRDFFNSIKNSIQYTSRDYETLWRRQGYPVIRLKLAYCYADENRFLASCELFDELIETGYEHLDVYSGKAFSLLGLDKPKEAFQTLLEWEKCHPPSKDYRLRKGLLLEQISLYDEAIEEYHNAYNTIDGGYEEMLRIANVYEKAGDITSALKAYLEIINKYHIYSTIMKCFVCGKIKNLEIQQLKRVANKGNLCL